MSTVKRKQKSHDSRFLVTVGDVDRKEVAHLISVVTSVYKKAFLFEPVKQVIVEMHRGKRWRWETKHSDSSKVFIRIGKIKRYPYAWHDGIEMLDWRDEFVLLYSWYLMFLADKSAGRRYSRSASLEMSNRLLRTWRVADAMDMVESKAFGD